MNTPTSHTPLPSLLTLNISPPHTHQSSPPLPPLHQRALALPHPISSSSTSSQITTPSSPAPTNPHPPPPPTIPNSIFQFNCNGIISSQDELSSLLHSKNVLIAALQETKLTSNSKLKRFPNFTTIRRDQPGNTRGGGLIILIHHSVPFIPLATDHLFIDDQVTEHLGITATINNYPLNIYIPPSTSCPPNFTPSLDRLLNPV